MAEGRVFKTVDAILDTNQPIVVIHCCQRDYRISQRAKCSQYFPLRCHACAKKLKFTKILHNFYNASSWFLDEFAQNSKFAPWAQQKKIFRRLGTLNYFAHIFGPLKFFNRIFDKIFNWIFIKIFNFQNFQFQCSIFSNLIFNFQNFLLVPRVPKIWIQYFPMLHFFFAEKFLYNFYRFRMWSTTGLLLWVNKAFHYWANLFVCHIFYSHCWKINKFSLTIGNIFIAHVDKKVTFLKSKETLFEVWNKKITFKYWVFK